MQGGFLSGSIMGVAAGAGMSTAANNVLRLFLNAAPLKKGGKLSGNVGMAQIHDFLRTGKGFDLSGAPVSAGYDIELSFELVSDGKGNWNLKSGQARYAGNTDADLTLSGDGGNVHRFTDRYRGQATAQLTPQNATITLRTTGKGKNQQRHFDVSASFPSNAVGKTTWSAMGGLQVITREDKGDVATWTLQMLGQEHKETKPEAPAYTGVSYGKSGQPDSVMRGRETWQDIMDSGVLVEWELWDECSASISSPAENDELVWDQSTPARLLRPAIAEVQPSFWDQDLHWSFHEITGSDLEPRPDKSDGNEFDVTYTKLPEKNSSFAYWDVTASFATERARKAGCKDPKPRTVGYFYPRDGANHTGPSSPVDPAANTKGPTPNWFHYWRQTKAAQGMASETRYGAGAPTCNIDGVGGYYTPGTSHVVVCDLGQAWGHYLKHPLVDLELHGVDNYAGVVRHEWTHHENYMRWWHGKGKLADTEVCKNKKGEIVTVSIGDDIPDSVEPTVKVPSPLNWRHKYFDSTTCDTLGLGFTDEHYIAWMAMTEWPVGSADTEDWACPGAQTFGKCS